jgi:hypothetical protein
LHQAVAQRVDFLEEELKNRKLVASPPPASMSSALAKLTFGQNDPSAPQGGNKTEADYYISALEVTFV